MSPTPTGAGSQSLPPLNLPSGGAGGSGAGPQDPMASLMSGLGPIKASVDGIVSACKQIVQSGAVPGAEQVCGQIIAMATSLLPMAAQSMLQPGGGAPQPGGVGPVGQGPQPIMGGQ
jgi:hypothetical protein